LRTLDFGRSIAVLANLGVIASLIFLAIEIRDSSIQARIATTQEVVAQRTQWRELIAADETLSDIYRRGLEDYQGLSPTEQIRFGVLMESFMFKLSANIQARDASLVGLKARDASLVGLNPDFEARSLEGDLLRMLDRPGFRQWWLAADRRGIPSNVVRMAEELDAMTTRH